MRTECENAPAKTLRNSGDRAEFRGSCGTAGQKVCPLIHQGVSDNMTIMAQQPRDGDHGPSIISTMKGKSMPDSKAAGSRRPGRVDMPRQKPEARRRNFDEVATGYTQEMALTEAARCLQCKKPLCVDGCPVEIDIPGFIREISAGNMAEACRILRDRNSLPAVCGRVCPQEDQCEKLCVLGKKSEPVAIGRLERYVADCERETRPVSTMPQHTAGGPEVAVIGSGPAGLTVAGDLAKLDYKFTIFEALHKPGGVLVYGIPEFRLPKAIVQEEVDYIKKLGAQIRTSVIVGRTVTIQDLMDNGCRAVFISSGAGLPAFKGIPGEQLNGVLSANEFLTRANLMKAYDFPNYHTPIRVGSHVAVVGAGNVAMDSARTALRLGADEVSIVYRRSSTEMPARAEEIENAQEEGVQMQLLTDPVRINGENGWATSMECLKMELGEPDDSGRRRPVPIQGSNFELPTDTVIMAIATGPNPLIRQTTPDLECNARGYIIADDQTGRTNKQGVWAGGDIVTGSATVILAMGAGRKAAKDIHEYLRKA
jgi:glutamate synthase (NADPH/NADH) small chain